MKIKKLLSVLIVLTMMICTIVPVSASTGFSANVTTLNNKSIKSATLYYSESPQMPFSIDGDNPDYTSVELTVDKRNISTNYVFKPEVIYVIVVATDINGQIYFYGSGLDTDKGTAKGGMEKTTSDQIVISDGSAFQKCYQIHLTFYPNGGTVAPAPFWVTKGLAYGTFGSLPTPTYPNNEYTFAGWYTEETGGTIVTNDTIVPKDVASLSIKLYAHWTINEKPTALFTETIADSGYTAEAADSEDIRGAIAVTVDVNNAVNFTLDDIAKYGFFYWRTAEGDLGINSEVAGSLSVSDPQFNTVVYDIDNAEENVLVKPYLVLNNGKTIYGDTISHTLNELNYNAEGKWLGTIETMLESLK